jgi:hypothetical protein
MSIEIGQSVTVKPSVESDLYELEQIRDNAIVGTVYEIRTFEYTPNDIGVDFGKHGRWWFMEHEIEVRP